ncbi:MAG: hypothetical protein FWE57_00930 [Chitinispirillia bacterium]|nr:hypothetical protein [Chitinispirillia bacterium]
MRKTILICAVITASAFSVWSGDKRQEDYTCFFAGVAMLRAERNLRADSTAVFYRELLSVCGVTTEGAIEFLEKKKSDPKSWREFNESILLTINEQFTTK